MTHRRLDSRRMRGASACLVAMALAWAVVPGLHALVHRREAVEERLEREAAAAHQRAHQRVRARRHRALASRAALAGQGAAPRDLADDAATHDHPHPHRGHHHHGGPGGRESPLEHGSGAPEHLGVAVLEGEPPALPVPGQAIDSAAPRAPDDSLRAAARRRAHGSRAPPVDLAPPQST